MKSFEYTVSTFLIRKKVDTYDSVICAETPMKFSLPSGIAIPFLVTSGNSWGEWTRTY